MSGELSFTDTDEVSILDLQAKPCLQLTADPSIGVPGEPFLPNEETDMAGIKLLFQWLVQTQFNCARVYSTS